VYPSVRAKRGQLPAFITLFVVTIFIAGVLIGFVVLSKIVKSFEEVETGEKVYSNLEIGLGGMLNYMKTEYSHLVHARVSIHEGKSIDESLKLSGYGNVGGGDNGS